MRNNLMRSLRWKLGLFLLFPTTLIIAGVGFIGFVFARDAILNEWKELSILKLQRAAHQIDMRLAKPVDLIEMFYLTGDSTDGFVIQERIVERLKALEGVKNVRLEFLEDGSEPQEQDHQMAGPRHRKKPGRMMRFHKARFVEVTPPRHDVNTGYDTVSLRSSFKDAAGREVGSLDVEVQFEHLLKDIRTLGWWQSHLAGLVDDSGNYLAHTETIGVEGHSRLGANGDPLELAVLTAMEERPYGTILGKGHPPEWVGGFYRLNRAPWTLVLLARGEAVLETLLRFRSYYAVAGLFTIAAVLVLMRWIGGKLVSSIKEIAQAADAVSNGTYGPPLRVTSRDEIGLLKERFNSMVIGLKEKDLIRNTFGRYVDPEIAKALLSRPGATRLGGEKREVAVLISDIRGFTRQMEPLDPESVIQILNTYFARMIEAIQAYHGIIVDFFGDGVLVFFDPLDEPLPETVLRAVCCATKMQGAMGSFNREMSSRGLPELKMGIGINVGEVIVGNIGSEARAKYGIVGTVVNITQRIQMEAEGDQILLSEPAYSQVREAVTVGRSFKKPLKGVQEDIELYMIEGVSGCGGPFAKEAREEGRP